MARTSIFLFLMVMLMGCNATLTKEEVENALRGNTFVATFKDMDVSLTIDFQDSTNVIFENDNSISNWKVVSNDNRVFLKQDGGMIEFYEVDQKVLKGRVITNEFLEVRFERQDVLYNRKDLVGVWVEEKYRSRLKSNLPKPLVPPYSNPKEVPKYDYQWPPLYTITASKIEVRYEYISRDSDIFTFNSSCCIMMDLEGPNQKNDKLWEIKTLNDSILVINRSSRGANFALSDNHFYDENVRFIKLN